jgi:hypothetical protein
VKFRRQCCLASLVLLGSGCLVRPVPVKLRAELVDSVLTTRDTLRISRIVSNVGSRPVYLHSGSTDIPFALRDSLGKPACTYEGVYTLVQIVAGLSAGDSVARPVNFPLRFLANCGPGRYSVTTWIDYATDPRANGPSSIVESPNLSLRIVPP